LPKNKMEI